MKMHFKWQVDTVLILSAPLHKNSQKLGKMHCWSQQWGQLWFFRVVGFDEMQKLLQGQESYVYREMEYHWWGGEGGVFIIFFLLHIWISPASRL